jgi:PAS domain S-box-containing protein
MPTQNASPDALAFLQQGGQMGALMRAKDWAQTQLGPPDRWPQALRTAVALMLRTRQPTFIGWGSHLISFYNDGYIPICGNKHPDGLGQPMSRLWGEIWDSLEPINASVLRGEAQFFEDMPFALAGRANTDLSYFSFSYTPLLDDEGRIAGIFCSAIETTEKVRLEQQRAQELERQQRMFKQAPGFICTLRGPEHVFDFVNDAHQRIFNRSDAVGRPVREAFPDLAGQGFYELLDQVYSTGERYVAQGLPVRLQTSPDTPEQHRRLDFIYAPIFDEGGRVSGIFCEGYDVTDAFAAQTALREQEEQLRLATDAAEVGLWDVDMVTDTLYWPARVKAMFGISPDVPVSMADYYAGLHPDDHDHTAASFAAACDPALRAVYDVEYRTIGKEDGVIRWIAAKGRGVFDGEARCIRVIGTAIDISARKAAETALLESEERARAADRRKDEFLATLAHELRNPLAPLRTSLHVLRARGETDPLFDVMDRQVHHLVRLVDDLLEVSRISHGAFELRRQPVEVAAIVRHAVETSEPLIRERAHTLEVHLPAESLWVDGDSVRLAQIISNLLNNAARYTPPGGRISVSAQQEDGCVEVVVTDSGVGFNSDDAPRIFEMFRRGKESSGLGIGLALSRKLAEMHGGHLDARSDGPGCGAEFTLRLAVASAAPAVETSIAVPRNLAGVRVLVVDDNEDAADTLELLLRHLGVQVSVAYDGKTALEEFATHRPSVVFVDIGMPQMDGYELARRLRERFADDSTLIVGLSGWGQEEDLRRGRDAGFDHHLIKPADISALRALLEQCAQSMDGTRELVAS